MFAPVQTPAPAVGVSALRVDLGRRLFYDRHLSVNNSLSCNSCHQLSNYGADPDHSVSFGHDKKPGGRNSPTVYNAGLQFAQFWDGRAATLAEQASGPMMNPVEMGMPGPQAVLAYLHSSPEYLKQFRQAYPDSKDPVVMDNVTNAIATFEEGLLTPARWDKYLQGDTSALSDEEKQGLRVYLRSGCASCHAGKSMGGNSYQKLGAYQTWPDQHSDTGRMAVTHQASDRMYFKVPILRNVEKTGPWFHDGQVHSVEQAVRLMGKYEAGEQLSNEDVHSIAVFLHALTGEIPEQYIQPPASSAQQAKAAAHPGSTRQNASAEGATSLTEGQ